MNTAQVTVKQVERMGVTYVSLFILLPILQLTTKLNKRLVFKILGRRGGLVVSELDSGSRGPGSGALAPLGHRVLFLDKILYSHGASLHPGVNGYQQTVRET